MHSLFREDWVRVLATFNMLGVGVIPSDSERVLLLSYLLGVIPYAFVGDKLELTLCLFVKSFNLLILVITSAMQGYCPSRSAVAKFRAEAVYNEFMKQWNIGVYFSLRYFIQLGDGQMLLG